MGRHRNPEASVERVLEYKRYLRSIADERPFGTLARVAAVTGVSAGRVSHMLNPEKGSPIPETHADALMNAIGLKSKERRRFVQLYLRAHTARESAFPSLLPRPPTHRRISVRIPVSPSAELDALIDRTVHRLAMEVVRSIIHASGAQPPEGDDENFDDLQFVDDTDT
ncbi:hypothetical protein SAMN05216456_1697 [Devosia crocina]|uniref:Uncharacterized protein n=1 Tax=Devosia crocina TaxID=429728 RepID=A0A1I7ND62_9HYPH|nr:hypothetical protein [Devosia crocina]SFV32579.1 hypothetical protein SAMN05216456_1697 [Devosia crocina]